MTQATTRRDLLRIGTSAAAYAAGAAIVTGGVALASEAKGASGISPALAKLLADRRAANDALDRWDVRWEADRAANSSDAVMSALHEEECALSTPIVHYDTSIEAFPCASMADLRAKVDHIHQTQSISGNSDTIFAAIVADVHRLIQEGR